MLNTQVVIEPAQPQATTEILLLEGGVVSGRVADVNGRPAPNARVMWRCELQQVAVGFGEPFNCPRM